MQEGLLEDFPFWTTRKKKSKITKVELENTKKF